MIVAIQQPPYLPWIGYFYKAHKANVVVHWDTDQIIRGRGSGNRNKVKAPHGAVYITVPIQRAGKGFQVHKDVKIADGTKWRKKHLETLRHCYARAEYFDQYFSIFEEHYQREWVYLDDLNVSLIETISAAIGLECMFVRASALAGVANSGDPTQRLARLVKVVGGTEYLSGFGGANYMDMSVFEREGVIASIYDFVHPIYEQLWGDFIPKLSIVDLLFNAGPGSLGIIKESGSEF